MELKFLMSFRDSSICLRLIASTIVYKMEIEKDYTFLLFLVKPVLFDVFGCGGQRQLMLGHDFPNEMVSGIGVPSSRRTAGLVAPPEVEAECPSLRPPLPVETGIFCDHPEAAHAFCRDPAKLGGLPLLSCQSGAGAL